MSRDSDIEFVRLRQAARTTDDFRRLAAFCRQQAETYRSQAAECDSGPLNLANRERARIHRELASHWAGLAELYLSQCTRSPATETGPRSRL